MSDERHGLIRDRLTAYLLEEQAVAVVCPSREAWQAFSVDGPYRFGWAPPVPVDDDETLLLVTFCPALIAATVEWLTDEQLDLYLWTVEQFLDTFINGFGTDITVLRQRTESALYEEEPEAIALLSGVEARAIDEHVVA